MSQLCCSLHDQMVEVATRRILQTSSRNIIPFSRSTSRRIASRATCIEREKTKGKQKEKESIVESLYVRMESLERARYKWQISRRYSTLYTVARGLRLIARRAPDTGVPIGGIGYRNPARMDRPIISSDRREFQAVAIRVPCDEHVARFRSTSSSDHDRMPLLRSRRR